MMMSKDYVPKYLEMRTDLARLTIRFIRSYDQFKEAADDLLALGVGIQENGQPRGQDHGDPTAQTAIQRERLLAEIRAIDKGIESVPEEYRQVVWEWVKEGKPLYTIDGSLYASDRTWYEYKRRFVTTVAREKGWIR